MNVTCLVTRLMDDTVAILHFEFIYKSGKLFTRTPIPPTSTLLTMDGPDVFY